MCGVLMWLSEEEVWYGSLVWCGSLVWQCNKSKATGASTEAWWQCAAPRVVPAGVCIVYSAVEYSIAK